MKAIERLVESLPAGTKIVSLFTETTIKHRKTNCPYKLIVRRCWRNGLIGANYANSVNNQREREGIEEEFTPESQWQGKGRFVAGSKRIVEHIEKGERYLAFLPKTIDNSPVILQDVYIADGQEVTKEEIEEYLPKTSESSRQETEKKIYWRVIKLDSIKAIRFGGETVTFA